MPSAGWDGPGRKRVRFEPGEDFARALDAEDGLAPLRDEFLIPASGSGRARVYLAGHSLGLQPRRAKAYIEQELADWERLGVEGHFKARNPWFSYHELVAEPMARVVGAKAGEVVVMNTLTVNLHLMLASFYRPTQGRSAILMESGAFPSDRYAAASQIRYHGFDPETSLLELSPRAGEHTLRTQDMLDSIRENGPRVALVLLGQVNFLTGQAFDSAAVVEEARRQGCAVGFDLAHAAGNLELQLHDWAPDFAVWCGYKYLNSGPGGLGGCFVHERHGRGDSLPRLAGWWGHNKATRFAMPAEFDPLAGAEGWQLSNPPIFPLASLRASLELFDRATMPALRRKSERLTAYLEFLIGRLPAGFCRLITPSDPAQRGCQLSVRIGVDAKALVERLAEAGFICDLRPPDILRLAPVPLYNSFMDVHRLASALAQHAHAPSAPVR
ncbi:MAG: kynureninase [Elusimicrobia bacterium]|nr:kynureninase [Elusimicrobiota bacterium]